MEERSPRDALPCTSQELSSESTEPFNCSICLELVYKPIVQACGHIFCFWCAFLAMNVRKESHCPVCRRPYNYFPRVCELLHFALSKAIPDEYGRRGHEVQRVEEQKQVFSPRLLESPRQLWSPRSLDEVAGLNSLSLTPRGVGIPNINASVGSITTEPALCSQNGNRHKDMGCARRDTSFMHSVLTVDDFCCASCKDLLYRPVVLNCGEVFCELCLKNTSSNVLYCPSCKAPHPANSILICLELHQYLESAFPNEYCRRKLQLPAESIRPPTRQIEDIGDCRKETADVGHEKNELILHVGVGCDGCGMYPIEGARYHCVQCTEKIGFDLCGSCYRGGTVLGRFNQEHQSNHHMEQVQHRVRRLLDFNMHNSVIQRRRQQQQAVSDLDDYINSFLDCV